MTQVCQARRAWGIILILRYWVSFFDHHGDVLLGPYFHPDLRCSCLSPRICYECGQPPFLSLILHLFQCGLLFRQTIAGQLWHGWNPFTDPYIDPLPQGIVRKPESDGPTTDIHNASLACNTFGTQPAALIADANAGDPVTYQMNNWPCEQISFGVVSDVYGFHSADHLGPLTGWMANW